MLLLVLPGTPAMADDIDDARRAISAQRFDMAETRLVEVARDSGGAERQEALFLLAGLKKSVSEAQIIYQEVIDMDADSRWGINANVELAKIEYALGRYDQAFNILEASEACGGRYPEGCYFQGLAATQLERYESASEALSRVRRGRYEPWATIALADIAMQQNDLDEACRQYRGMARANINPTAMYRYGECLEKMGDGGEATEVFQELLETFAGTPEAVLAAEKLEVLTTGARSSVDVDQPEASEAPAPQVLTSGFTIQFGSFEDRANAIRLAAQLKRSLPGIRIDSDLINYKEVHRVRLGYFATRPEAQEKADEITGVVTDPFSIMTLH